MTLIHPLTRDLSRPPVRDIVRQVFNEAIVGTGPVLGSLADGDTLAIAVAWGSYTSTPGSIAGTEREVSVNGAAFAVYDGTVTVSGGDRYQLRETVTDSEANVRIFTSASQIVSGVAPTVAASDSLSLRTVTIAVDSLAGVPNPTSALTALTLDGQDILGSETGSGPWSYVAPDSASPQAVGWEVTASNVEGSATASGDVVVAANLFAPSASTAPVFQGSVTEGQTITLSEGTYAGTAPVLITGTLALDGADVTNDIQGFEYTIPMGTAGQILTWTETASNGIAPDASQNVTETIMVAGDTTAPVLANLVTDDTVSPLVVTFDLEEDSGAADVHWVLVPTGAAAPTAVEVAAQQAAGGGAPADSGTFTGQALGTGVSGSTSIADGLDGAFDIYVVAEDAAGNLSDVVSDTGLNIDTTDPVIAITSVTPGDGQLTVDWQTDTDEGVARFVAVAAGSAAPTSAEVLAGQVNGGGVADGDSGNIAVSQVGGQSAVVISGLSNGVAYDVHLVHQDAAVEPNATLAASDGHTPAPAAAVENRVRFDSASSYLHFPTHEFMSSGLLCFFSLHRPVATNWLTVFHSSTDSNSLGVTRWNNANQLAVSFADIENLEYTTGFRSPQDWTGTGRINFLASVTVATGRLLVYSKVDDNPWRLFADTTHVAGRNIRLDAFTIGKRTDLSTGNYAGNDLYRVALWEGVPPDVSQASVQDLFMDGDSLADRANSVTAYGTPHLDVNGNAAEYAAGANDGDWGALSTGGTFSDQ